MNDLVEALARAVTPLDREARWQAVREHADYPKMLAFWESMFSGPYSSETIQAAGPFGFQNLIHRCRFAVRENYGVEP